MIEEYRLFEFALDAPPTKEMEEGLELFGGVCDDMVSAMVKMNCIKQQRAKCHGCIMRMVYHAAPPPFAREHWDLVRIAAELSLFMSELVQWADRESMKALQTPCLEHVKEGNC